MAKFKVGDKVRVVDTKFLFKKEYVGHSYTIKKILCPFNDGRGPRHVMDSDPGYIFYESELELIKPKFNINDYPGKCAMHVATKEEDKIFREYLDSLGRRWVSGDRYISKGYYHVHEYDTCYNFNYNLYDNIYYYKQQDYTILEFNDFDWSDFTMKKEFTKADLKNGDIIKRRDNSVEIFIPDLNVCVGEHGDYSEIKCINDDLKSTCSTNRDIVAVRRINCNYGNPFMAFKYGYGELIYERKEVEEMTLEEVCKALGKEIKIVKK